MPGTLSGVQTGFTDRGMGRGIYPSSMLQRMGKGGALCAGGGNISVQVGAAGNGADATEDVLFTATLPANTLDIVGRQILLEAFGAISATNATKTLKVYFGASIVWTVVSVASAATAGDWSASLLLTKSGPNAQVAIGAADFSGASTVRSVTKFLGGS
jgi:hypothetical protein